MTSTTFDSEITTILKARLAEAAHQASNKHPQIAVTRNGAGGFDYFLINESPYRNRFLATYVSLEAVFIVGTTGWAIEWEVRFDLNVPEKLVADFIASAIADRMDRYERAAAGE